MSVSGARDPGAVARRLAADDPHEVCSGARAAEQTGDPRCAWPVACVLACADTALLLAADPEREGESVEDALLRAAARVFDPDDGELRRPLLLRLRNAGLVDVEVPLLCSAGDAADLEAWLPAVLVELGAGPLLDLLTARAAGDDPQARVIRALLGPGEEGDVDARSVY